MDEDDLTQEGGKAKGRGSKCLKIYIYVYINRILISINR
jgi:hypothetical protein